MYRTAHATETHLECYGSCHVHHNLLWCCCAVTRHPQQSVGVDAAVCTVLFHGSGSACTPCRKHTRCIHKGLCVLCPGSYAAKLACSIFVSAACYFDGAGGGSPTVIMMVVCGTYCMAMTSGLLGHVCVWYQLVFCEYSPRYTLSLLGWNINTVLCVQPVPWNTSTW